MATMSDPFRSFLQTRQEISPQCWKPRQQVWEQLFIQTEMPPGNSNIYQPELGGLISQPHPIHERQEGWQAERGAGSWHRALLLPNKADTSLVPAPVGAAENKECRHTKPPRCEAQPKVLPTPPQHQQWGHKGHWHSCSAQHEPRATPTHTWVHKWDHSGATPGPATGPR